MIQAVSKSSFDAYLSTEDVRIDTSVGSDKIRYLMKFINTYNTTPDVYTGATKLLPAGYYNYEVYEVSWTGAVAISAGNAPVNENDVLPVAPTHGVVQGLITQGKLYVSEKSGTEEVRYKQYEQPASTNYIYYGN